MTKIIVATNPKTAAIYYDEVIPVGLIQEEVIPNLGSLDSRFLQTIDEIPIEKLLPAQFKADVVEIKKLSATVFLSAASSFLEELNSRDASGEAAAVEAEAIARAKEAVAAFDNRATELFQKFSDAGAVYDALHSDGTSVESADLVLSRVALVDASAATWDQVFEFREDSNARLALLNFRKFLYESFDGWSEEQIVEELERLKLQYDEAAKKHGFDLTAQSITSILSTRAVAGGGVLGFIAAGAGLPLTSMAIAASPIVVELGRFAFQVGRDRHSMAQFQRDNPVSFISLAEKKLG